MLNRTNRTLSANLNRLNLGTRSLAAPANVNNGVKTLRTRHAHRVVMRDGMTGYQQSPIPIADPDDVIPAIPHSSSVSPRLVASRVVIPVRVDVAAVSFPDADRSCRFGEFPGRSLERGWQRPGTATTERKPEQGERSFERLGLGSDPARASLTAAAAAILAAAGG